MLLLRATGTTAYGRPGDFWTAYNAGPVVTERARIEAQLESYPGQHLVIVRYEPHSNPGIPWVYNGANIDDARIVWAWDMGTAANQELVDYYQSRHVWLIETNSEAPKLVVYPMPSKP